VRRLLWSAIGVAAAITTTLVLFPTLDVAISRLAYGPDGFVLPRSGLVLAMSWLVVNTILKHHVGRARPIEIVQFGGDAQFSRAGFPADQCRRNCTFPSGDASAAFALAAVGVATGSPAVLAGALVIGTLVSIVRVLTGAHFVSDVASSAVLTLLAIVLLVQRPRAAPG
jgi:membrane-associated PAP2 superfamily phosphatase